jgi:hypothetical protein
MPNQSNLRKMQNLGGKTTTPRRGETTPEPTVFSNIAGLFGGFLNGGQSTPTPQNNTTAFIDTKKYKPS